MGIFCATPGNAVPPISAAVAMGMNGNPQRVPGGGQAERQRAAHHDRGLELPPYAPAAKASSAAAHFAKKYASPPGASICAARVS